MQKFLRVVPSPFDQVATSIETAYVDLRTLSIEELTCRLWVVEDRLDDGRESFGGEWSRTASHSFPHRGSERRRSCSFTEVASRAAAVEAEDLPSAAATTAGGSLDVN